MFGLQPLTELPAFATALLGFNQAVILPYFQPESLEFFYAWCFRFQEKLLDHTVCI
jgi:hypothetical protein